MGLLPGSLKESAIEMGSYSNAAAYYDLLYSVFKDYESETTRLREIIAEACPGTARVLDVGCGTGRHAQLLRAHGFSVDGLDFEPEFVRIAQARNPAGRFRVGDMRSFSVSEPYDVVVSLFGSIGYALDETGLRATVGCLAAAARAGGVVIVEPWLEPADVTDGYVTMQSARGPDGLAVCRMSRTLVRAGVSRLEFEYLIGRAEGIEHVSETHDLGLFTKDVMIGAMEGAGLRVAHDREGLMGRGLYVGTKVDTTP